MPVCNAIVMYGCVFYCNVTKSVKLAVAGLLVVQLSFLGCLNVQFL